MREEVTRLRRENRDLKERIEKQNQFIEGLAQKFPQVREEFDRMRRGYTFKPERPPGSLVPV
ncbi:MAG: hypothetical protein Q8Q95_00950 [bacterium]|nr:hypothetical protein [bacterium]